MNYWAGPLVTLRGIELGDVSFFHEWNQETHTQQHMDQIWFPSSLRRVEEWVEKQSTASVAEDHFFFVILNKAGERVGMVHVHDCHKKNGHFSYAVGIREAQRHKGYARAAIRMVLDYYFHQLRYHKVTVGIYAFNEASIRLHEQLGFQQEGRLREMIYADSAYHDLLKFGLLKREFKGPVLG